jgi:hypothetical protein
VVAVALVGLAQTVRKVAVTVHLVLDGLHP